MAAWRVDKSTTPPQDPSVHSVGEFLFRTNFPRVVSSGHFPQNCRSTRMAHHGSPPSHADGVAVGQRLHFVRRRSSLGENDHRRGRKGCPFEVFPFSLSSLSSLSLSLSLFARRTWPMRTWCAWNVRTGTKRETWPLNMPSKIGLPAIAGASAIAGQSMTSPEFGRVPTRWATVALQSILCFFIPCIG